MTSVHLSPPASPTSANFGPPLSPKLSNEDYKALEAKFQAFDSDSNGYIDAQELKLILQELDEPAEDQTVRELIAEVDQDHNGKIEFGEFVEVVTGIRSSKVGGFSRVFQKQEFQGYNEALRFAAKTGNVDRVQDLVRKGADPAVATPYGNTALHIAAIEGHLSIVRHLLENYKAVSATALTNRGESALHYAAQWGRLDVCKYLVDQAGCDQVLFEEDLLGYTPIDYAQYRGFPQVQDYLYKSALRVVGNDIESYRRRFRRESLLEEEDS
jgi:hypothetical protein